METVICAKSFEERRELAQVCALGYNVAESSRLIFWASDMMHRLFHLPTLGYGYIEHFADGYEEIVTASENDNEQITHDTDALQYFALEAYAHDIAVPGEGCPGPALEDLPETESSSSSSSSPSSTMAETMAETMVSSTVMSTQEEEESASATAEAGEVSLQGYTVEVSLLLTLCICRTAILMVTGPFIVFSCETNKKEKEKGKLTETETSDQVKLSHNVTKNNCVII